MSLHAQLSPEALEKLRKQQRNSTLSSIIISILLVLLVGILLFAILLDPIDNFTPEIVSYQAGIEDTEKVKKRDFSRAVQRKPSAPSSSMSKVIAAATRSSLAIPVPEIDVPEASVDFGDGDDFGDGWGDGGFGAGAGTTSFFGKTIKGRRILYIIDFSASMKGERQKLMRKELSQSVYKLSPDIKYQMIFFAGPAWVAGNKVQMNGKKTASIVDGGASYSWVSAGKAHDWKPSGKRQSPTWLQAMDQQVEASKKIITSHKLVWGTNWKNPLEMIFEMDPLPETVLFMTDGVAKGDPIGVAKKMATRAKKKNITINTIALMEPKAVTAMKALAKGSGGTFTLIKKGGEVVKEK